MKYLIPLIAATFVMTTGCVQKPAPEPVIKIKTVYKEVPAREGNHCKGILDYYELFSLMEKKTRKLELNDMRAALKSSDDNCLRLKIGVVLSQPGSGVQNNKAAKIYLQRFSSDQGEIEVSDLLLAKLVLDGLDERKRIQSRLSRSYNKQVQKLEAVNAETQAIESNRTEASSAISDRNQQEALDLLAQENAELRKKLEQLKSIEQSISKKEQDILVPALSN